MKKNILFVLMLSCTVTPLCMVPLYAQDAPPPSPAPQSPPTSPTNDTSDEDNVEDFFGEPDILPAAPSEQKQQWSGFKLAMIKLGVAIALRTQTLCRWVYAFWAYLASLVMREQKSAQA